MSDRWLKCKDCPKSSPLKPPTKSTARVCKISGDIYAAEHTCHYDEDVREGKYDISNRPGE